METEIELIEVVLPRKYRIFDEVTIIGDGLYSGRSGYVRSIGKFNVVNVQLYGLEGGTNSSYYDACLAFYPNEIKLVK